MRISSWEILGVGKKLIRTLCTTVCSLAFTYCDSCFHDRVYGEVLAFTYCDSRFHDRVYGEVLAFIYCMLYIH